MYKISEHRVLYIVSLFTTPRLMGVGKGCYKRRSSSIVHIHMCTGMLPHTWMEPHAHTCLCVAVSNQALIHWTKRGNTAQLMGLRSGSSILSLSLEKSASSVLLLRSVIPQRCPVQELAQLISAVVHICCCLAATCMICVDPGGHLSSH